MDDTERRDYEVRINYLENENQRLENTVASLREEVNRLTRPKKRGRPPKKK